MPYIYKWIVPLLLLVLILSGCQGPSSGSTASTSPAFMLSIQQIASRLNLSVTGNNGRYYELTNAANRVLIFSHPGGNLYVNGQDAGPVGGIVESGGRTWFSQLLVPRIRGRLKSAAPTPTPTYSHSAPAPSKPFASGTVIIDAGHGGKDPGAPSYLGYPEKKINLAIARKVASRLQNRGIQVVLTRGSDYFVELDDRVAIANRVRPDLFVSIHGDSNHNRMHQGFTIYVSPNASDASRRAGRLLEGSLSRAGIESKGMRTADYRVLVKTTCPAVLVECGFLSNPSEAALLLDGDYQNRLADAITSGILQAVSR